MSQSTTLNLSIPVKLKKQTQAQATIQNFSSTSDYLQTLIREDIKRTKELKQFELFIRQGLRSGKSKNIGTKNLDTWMADVINKTK